MTLLMRDQENIEKGIEKGMDKGKAVIPNRIGIAKGQKLYDDDYDFDEMNPEIVKMFGGME